MAELKETVEEVISLSELPKSLSRLRIYVQRYEKGTLPNNVDVEFKTNLYKKAKKKLRVVYALLPIYWLVVFPFSVIGELLSGLGNDGGCGCLISILLLWVLLYNCCS